MTRVITLALPVPFPVAAVNAYLLPGEPLTLIDAGPRTPEAEAALEAGLGQHGLRVEDLRLLVLTHHHVDHAALAATVRARSGCTVAAHPVAARALADLERGVAADGARARALLERHGAPPEIVATVAPSEAIAFAHSTPLAEVQALADGDRVGTLTARHRPGHSGADLVLTTDGGQAIVGDHLLPGGPTPLVIEADGEALPSALLTYRASLAATLADRPRRALPGHGEAIENPVALTDGRLRSQLRRAERLHVALAAGPLTAWQLVGVLRGGRPVDGGVHPVAPAFITLGDVLAHLRLLAHAGRVRQAKLEDVVAFELDDRRGTCPAARSHMSASS